VDGYTCTFENKDLCGWTNYRGDNFDWVRGYGTADAQEKTGPVSGVDGEGYYMNADTSASGASSPGRMAKFVSPSIDYRGTRSIQTITAEGYPFDLF